MQRRVALLFIASSTALHVQRRALIAPAIASLVAPTVANAGLLDFDPEAAKAAGRARAEERRAAQQEFTDKLGTLGGVEGQVTPVGGAAAQQDSRDGGSGGLIKMKRAPDRKGEGAEQQDLLGDLGLPEVKYQQKRSFNGKEGDDMSSNGIFKMKRGIGKPLGIE